MTGQEKSILISKYEKIKGYSSDLFDNEEWAEFDAFCIGCNLGNCLQCFASSRQLRINKKQYNDK